MHESSNSSSASNSSHSQVNKPTGPGATTALLRTVASVCGHNPDLHLVMFVGNLLLTQLPACRAVAGATTTSTSHQQRHQSNPSQQPSLTTDTSKRRHQHACTTPQCTCVAGVLGWWCARPAHSDFLARSNAVSSSTPSTSCAAACARAARARARPAWCTTAAYCRPPRVVTPRASLGGACKLSRLSHSPYLSQAGATAGGATKTGRCCVCACMHVAASSPLLQCQHTALSTHAMPGAARVYNT